jgi:2-polyprenyl-6-methoxyphenol hydroxylase-like FAD-dependent oxidoreductase
VLAGDAGCLKDPSTGAGMGDALTQSFLLSDALDAALSGADWEASLGEFQRKRDEALLPIFEGTIAFTQMPDATPDAIAWLHTLLGSPVLVRMLTAGLPGAIPHLFPPPMQTQLEASQRQFAAATVAMASRMARE